MSLFSTSANLKAPLAERMRPKTIGDFFGQEGVVGSKGILTQALLQKRLFSMIFWGPPGSGKTSLAQLFAQHTDAQFISLSSIAVGTKEIKELMTESRDRLRMMGKHTVLFLDEIHRFNRTQQDAFLPFVEKGDVILIGATTENPSYELNHALLSRMRVIVLQGHSQESLLRILKQAMEQDHLMKACRSMMTEEVLFFIAERSAGDARSALNLLEQAVFSIPNHEQLSVEHVSQVLQRPTLPYDKSSEEHYNCISALHKSVRNSDVQAALYWLGRMLESGEDPLYIVRRLVRFASEDIGNADPRALMLAIASKETVEFLGLPECKVTLAQLVIYLSSAPKSNAAYTAYKNVEKALALGKVFPVPLALRNANTTLMKEVGYGKNYTYAHDYLEGVSPLECLPEELKGSRFYLENDNGYESKIKLQIETIQKLRLK